MPEEPKRSSICGLDIMSRVRVSCNWVVQFHPIAPQIWPALYAEVSTSTSTRQIVLLLRLAATQEVLTKDSGCAYCDIYPLYFVKAVNQRCWHYILHVYKKYLQDELVHLEDLSYLRTITVVIEI